MPTTELLQAILLGVTTGSILILGAIGLALLYTIGDIPNFAHGEVITLGAFVALIANQPASVPVFNTLTVAGGQTLSPAGKVVLFVLTVCAVLAIPLLVGGRPTLYGRWWPVTVPPILGVGVHLIVAIAYGIAVVVTLPTLISGTLLSIVVVANVALLSEVLVFRKFRDQDPSLATMFIVALGLIFIIRYGIQATFGPATRRYAVNNIVSVFGAQIHLLSHKIIDIYAATSGITLHIVDTGPANNPTIFHATYSWFVVTAAGLAVIVASFAVYRGVRSRWDDPLLQPWTTACLTGVVVVVPLSMFLGSGAQIPDNAFYSTRVRISIFRFLTIILALSMVGALHILLQRTKLGTAIRASRDNIDLAKAVGINTDVVIRAVWIIAGAFAAIAGILLGVLFGNVSITMGFSLLLPMFAAIILGGFGSIYGAVYGGLIVGLSMEIGIYAIPGLGPVYQVPLSFAVLILVLLVKPEGITGGR